MNDPAVRSTHRLGDLEVVTIVTGQRWRQNCYLLHELPSSAAVLIDPGDDADALWHRLGAREATLAHVLLTHGHYDHVGAAAAISQRATQPCRLHHDDARTLRHAPAYAASFERRRIEPVTSLSLFQNGETFQLGRHQISALHLPGHTPGSVAYVVGGFVFTGDTLFHRRVGRTDLPGGDVAALAASVERLLSLLTDETIVLPGHGRASTIGDARTWWAAEGRETLLRTTAAAPLAPGASASARAEEVSR